MRKRIKRHYIIVILLIIGIAVLSFTIYSSMVYAPNNSISKPEQTKQNNNSQEDKIKYPFIDLQPVVDEWNLSHSGTASIVIYDVSNDKNAAALNADRQYFAASIYKLYVTYFGYQELASGAFSANEEYWGEWTRGKCLDEMIRSSHSPCAEKLWTELGKESLTQKLKEIGINDTSMTGLTTTAEDAAKLLNLLLSRDGITDEHAKLYLSSMKDQESKYRRGLPSGFTKSTVYNKVGWNETIEWHDSAIVTLPSGREYVICVFTKNVGYSNIAALGKKIEDKLLKQ